MLTDEEFADLCDRLKFSDIEEDRTALDNLCAQAKDELVELRQIVDRLPKLVELAAIDAIRNFMQHGHEMSERDCYPNLYKRGDKWRYHRRIAANEWADEQDPIVAAEKARKP